LVGLKDLPMAETKVEKMAGLMDFLLVDLKVDMMVD